MTSVSKDVEKLGLVHCLWECKIGQSLHVAQRFLKKLNRFTNNSTSG
jgi:hypothetical protein